MLVNAGMRHRFPLLSAMRWTPVCHPTTSRGVCGSPWLPLRWSSPNGAPCSFGPGPWREGGDVPGQGFKKAAFTHLQTLSLSYYNNTPVGTIMARVMSDTNKIGSVFAWSLVDIF